jgi:hypothetical protein
MMNVCDGEKQFLIKKSISHLFQKGGEEICVPLHFPEWGNPELIEL